MRDTSNRSLHSARRLPAGRSGTPARGSIFDDLPRLADLAKRVYTLERRMQESGLTEEPSRYAPAAGPNVGITNLEAAPRQPVWMKLARFLARDQLGPIDYIARQFDECRCLAKPLFPNELLGATAWDRYTTSKATKHEDLRLRLRSYRSSLAGHDATSAIVWAKGRVNRDTSAERYLSALYCDQSLSPLFVYCVAVELAQNYPAYAADASQLAQQFVTPACVEYVRFRRDYDAVWGSLIPGDFREIAEAIYRDLLGEL